MSHSVVGVTRLSSLHANDWSCATRTAPCVFDLASGSAVCCCIVDSWTFSAITILETISYTDFPFFFAATADGNVHVVHEETGRVSTGYLFLP